MPPAFVPGRSLRANGMRRPNRPGWLATNLLLLAATIFIGLLLFFLSDLFTDDAKSRGVIVSDALAGSIFLGLLIFVPALPGGVAYLLLLRRIARRVSGARLRALALLLSPISILPLLRPRDFVSARFGLAVWDCRSTSKAKSLAVVERLTRRRPPASLPASVQLLPTSRRFGDALPRGLAITTCRGFRATRR